MADLHATLGRSRVGLGVRLDNTAPPPRGDVKQNAAPKSKTPEQKKLLGRCAGY